MSFFSETAPATSSGGATLATPQTTTSGTAFNFTGLPSGVTRIAINFAGVALSGSDNLLIQIGDSGGLETTGYTSSALGTSSGGSSGTTSTSGFVIYSTGATVHGTVTLWLLNSSTNLWVASGTMTEAASAVTYINGGSKALSATLDRVTVTRTGTNTFAAGSLNIAYG